MHSLDAEYIPSEMVLCSASLLRMRVVGRGYLTLADEIGLALPRAYIVCP
jgi:hypothetical protein